MDNMNGKIDENIYKSYYGSKTEIEGAILFYKSLKKQLLKNGGRLDLGIEKLTDYDNGVKGTAFYYEPRYKKISYGTYSDISSDPSYEKYLEVYPDGTKYINVKKVDKKIKILEYYKRGFGRRKSK